MAIPLILDGKSLTIDDVLRSSRPGTSIRFSPRAVQRINASRRVVEQWLSSGETVYGVTTGFGEFSNVRIGPKDLERLQENLIVSHAAGAGPPLPDEIVRAMMVLRLNALAGGYSGVRHETLDVVRRVYNLGIVPVIPSRGSVGSSGDLAPLAHLVLAMLGKGEVRWRGRKMRSRAALRAAGITPLRLSAKEGLALVNGTQMMSAYGALAVHAALRLCTLADIAGAMTVEALRGSDTPFDARIHRLRPHRGQGESAANLRALMRGSAIRESHRYGDPRVQDAYSLRCMPQIHGAARDAIRYVHGVVATEINSATDNPLIIPGANVHLEGGNFHGEPLAIALDLLAIALAELASVSERRTERMVNGTLSGLPRFLTEKGGLNSGLMIAQYTAASLVSENKVLAHPASVDSIPTSANQEDHNSMGSISAQKAWQVLANVQTVLAIELMVAAQGLDFTRKRNGPVLRAGRGVEAAYRAVRDRIPHLGADRVLYDDITAALGLVTSDAVTAAVERTIGILR